MTLHPTRCVSVVVALLTQTAFAAPVDPPLGSKVDELFSKWDSTVSPGCSVAVMKDGAVVYKRGYGMADLEHQIPNSPTTVFHIASISKQFAAASMALLAQDGKLSVDDPVRQYVPELPDFGTPITIRQMVSHTSGLRDQWELLELSGWRYSFDLITDDDVMAVVTRQKELNFPPNSQFLYSNTGYTLLGQIVKRVSGQSLREFTTARIFEPLGMRNTHFRDDFTEIVPNIADGYTRDGDRFKISVTNFNTAGATSLLTTVEDMALWDENFYSVRVGGPELKKQMVEQGVLNSGEKIDYAFGVSIGTYRGLPTVSHGGSDAGYRADMLRFPDQHFGVICLCNVSEASPGALTRKIADLYLAKDLKPLPAAADPKKKAYKLSERQITSRLGTYVKQDDGRAYRIVRKDNALQIRDASDLSYDLIPVSANRFRMSERPIEVEFGEGAQRQIRTLPDGGKAEIYEWAPEYTATPADLAAYVGTYESDEIEMRYRLTVDNGTLMLSALKVKPTPLRSLTQDVFNHGDFGGFLFQRDAGGQVTGFILNTGRIRHLKFAKRS